MIPGPVALVTIPPDSHTLGVSYVNALLRQHSQSVLCFDFNHILARRSPETALAVRHLFSVHNPYDLNRVQYVLRVTCPRFLYHAE